jgi:hypothetical protein
VGSQVLTRSEPRPVHITLPLIATCRVLDTSLAERRHCQRCVRSCGMIAPFRGARTVTRCRGIMMLVPSAPTTVTGRPDLPGESTSSRPRCRGARRGHGVPHPARPLRAHWQQSGKENRDPKGTCGSVQNACRWFHCTPASTTAKGRQVTDNRENSASRICCWWSLLSISTFECANLQLDPNLQCPVASIDLQYWGGSVWPFMPNSAITGALSGED